MSVTLLRNSSRVFTTTAKETLPMSMILVKSSFTSINNTSKTPYIVSNLPGYSSLKLTQWLQCQWRGHWTYLILNLFDTEPIRYRTYLIPNLSDTKPIRYQTHPFPSLPNSEPIWFWTYLIPNSSDTEPIRYQTYQIPNLPDTEPGRYWTRYQTCRILNQ